MKLQITWDDSHSFGRKELKRFTLEGHNPEEIEGVIQGYVRPMLLSMGYSESNVDECLGER